MTCALVLVAFGVAGFPAIGRAPLDWTLAWTLALTRPGALMALILGGLFIGWASVWQLQRLLFAESDPTTIIDATSRSRDLSGREVLALLPMLAWAMCAWCQPGAWQGPPAEPVRVDAASENPAP
jgi:hypothetical protein